jgi:integrase
MAMTDTAIKALKPGAKPRKVFDGDGLYIEISSGGSKWWRLKYYSPVTRKENRLSLGVYPNVSLKTARERCADVRKQLADGIDPGAQRRRDKLTKAHNAVNTFEAVTREWYSKFSPGWAKSHSKRLIAMFERDVFPEIGDVPIALIEPLQVLAIAERVADRSPDTARRLLRRCGQVFSYGVLTMRCKTDPTFVLRGKGKLIRATKRNHFAATTEPRRLGQILDALDAYPGTLIVASALRLTPLLFVRPGELRKAEWAQIDWERREWRYKVTKTQGKGIEDHVVPLCLQALAILEELRKLTGRGKLIFPGARGGGRPMSENAVLVAMRSLEIGQEEMTGHGFRAVARTLLDEELHFRADVIEHQLAHKVVDPLGRAYNRTQFLEERHRMMQAWADHLDILKVRSRRDTSFKDLHA